MSAQQFFLPDFKSRRVILRFVWLFLAVAFFLAVFEVGLIKQLGISDIGRQFYLHAFFLLSTGLLIFGVIELRREQIIALPKKRAWMAIWIISMVMLSISTIWVNVFHYVTGVQRWHDKRFLFELFFHLPLGTVFVGLGLHYFDLQQRLVMRHAADLQQRVFNLESRMQPHFFFNSMNTLLYLVESQDEKAAGFVEEMASFFRISLKPPHMVSVNQEVDICKGYLQIESLRLGEQFKVDWQIDNVYDLYTPQLPSLTIQPILEYFLTEGTQFKNMLINIDIKLASNAGKETLYVKWTTPMIDDSTYISGLEQLLGKINTQLDARLGESARLVLQPSEQNHTITLTYDLNSVL